MPRQNYIIVICGRRGSGKTVYARKLAAQIGKKTLVVDLMDHPTYRDFGTMPPEKLQYWRDGNYRVYQGLPEKNIELANKHAWNSTLILEDAARYINSNMTQAMKALFVECKQRNQDIIVMYHALREIPPYLLQMYDILVLFPTDENIMRERNRFYNFDKIHEAHRAVMTSKVPYTCKVISK